MKVKKIKSEQGQEEQKVHNKKWRLPGWYIGFWAVFLILGGTVAFLATYYNGRLMPNLYVGGVEVGNKTASEITSIVEDEVARLAVTFEDSTGNKVTAPINQLGVNVDVAATVQNIMSARRSQDITKNIAVWQADTFPLVYTNDAGMFKAFAVANFPYTYTDPQDAQVIFNSDTNQFEVQASVAGQGFDVKSFEENLPTLMSNPQSVTLAVSTVPVEPIISDSAATKAKDEANAYLALSIEFLRSGSVVYAASPADIASWMHFVPDTTAGTLAIEFDSAVVSQFVNDQVAGSITTLPRERKVIVDSQTGAETVIQEGRTGYQLEGSDSLVSGIMEALANKVSYSKEVTVEEAPFTTVVVSTDEGKWIEVDLSDQTTTLYIGNTAIATYSVSTGKAATPTAISESKIYAKYTMQTMTGTINGEYYYVPDIPWVSYFYNGEAFHGTYWHHNFGHPMSHGCVNMTISDAKTLYDFAPIGTRVVVHA